ncbi:hypothetical protein BCV71DRAFT_252693 [Rhizopus microsporus]|uniref:Uncharacterized protein n=1 Tax=Rhizopus microsporus TaxID=58291 RepID=A0A1X0SEN1_RHIZD|nr:hypothetical protein BCV71DRAFT_252693 [Rhizopus microsporus]
MTVANGTNQPLCICGVPSTDIYEKTAIARPRHPLQSYLRFYFLPFALIIENGHAGCSKATVSIFIMASADTSNGFQQTFQVVSSKETRDYRRIIKPFIIFTNQDCYLYPVRASIVLRYHPSLSHLSTRSSLFVNSRCPQEPLATLTISTCLHNTIRISTEERNVSVRTIASSLALCHGIPKEDSVILGNWTNSPTFENHYRREHMPCFNFT